MSKKLSAIKNIVFDADGTLLLAENPYLAIAHALQCETDMRELIESYFKHEISYQQLVDEETKDFISQYKKLFGRHPQIGDLEKYLPAPALREEAESTIATLLKQGKNVYVLTSGFLYLVRDLTKLKIKLNHIHANRFLYDTNGDFVMIKIDVSGDKVEGFDAILTEDHLDMQETAYVGDNAFDEMIINHVLEEGGNVFFLKNTDVEFVLKSKPDNERFVEIENLRELLSI